MSKSDVTVAVDAMGGDHGIETTVPAVLRAVDRADDLKIILFGDQSVIAQALGRHASHPQISIEHAEQVVDMDELPATALRNKKRSSMRLAINAVKESRADACVSAGNTGALMATAKFVLKTIEGIDRPAICTHLPTQTGHVHMLDLGANVDCNPNHLLQFAVMGDQICRALDSNPEPRVCLLNVGAEDIKGNELVKATAELIHGLDINYTGFIEADAVFEGGADVVVCDGFVGNVALKTAEGIAKMIAYFLKRAFRRNLWTKFCALLAMPILKSFANTIDPRAYNGASFLGLRGAVIKSHGGADALAFANAINIAYQEAQYQMPVQIGQAISKQLVGSE